MFNRPFLALLAAQFLSAFADNAILVALIAGLVPGSADQSALLQELFVIPFILLAPFAGPLSDFLPKSLCMLLANLLKTAGCAMAFFSLSPFASYLVIGIGACLYSPAKYGILPELADPEHIVKANSAVEGSTIAAILIGVLAGGALCAANPAYCVGLCFALYAMACAATLLIPKSGKTQPFPPLQQIFSDFKASLKVFAADSDTRGSLAGSSSFWGAGAALRLALFAWAPFALGATDPTVASQLMGIMAVGTIAGAVLSAIFGDTQKLGRNFIAGLAIGPAVILMALVSHSFPAAAAFLFLIGLLGGFFVIPLNALVQEKGHKTVGAGRALATQNLAENTLILLCSAFYGAVSKYADPSHSAAFLGALLFALILAAASAWKIRAARAQ